MSHFARKEIGVAAGRGEGFRHQVVEVVALPRVEVVRVVAVDWKRRDRFRDLGQIDAKRLKAPPCRALSGAEFHGRIGAEREAREVVAEPAERQLLPPAHVHGMIADRIRRIRRPRPGAHQRPVARAVVRSAGRVVEVGQSEIVAELVREDADAAVLGLDGVVAHPQVRAGQVVAAQQASGRSGVVIGVRVPRVTPDRVSTLRAAAGFLAFAGVHEAEVIDIAVGLGEVAVAIAIVAIDLIGLRQVEATVVA